LGVSKSGFYKQLNQKETKTYREKLTILECINKIRKNVHKKAYGAPRLKTELLDEYNVKTTMKRISKIMREYGIKVNGIKKFKAGSASSKPPQNVKENLLKQNFKAERKNQIWVTDITYIWTKDGWLYLSSILDLWSKKIIHYEIRNTMDKKLVIDTLEKAYLKEQPELETIIHSDQGSQYTSNDYCKLAEQLKMRQSMSRRGNCYDNAVIESFHASIKKEMVYLQGVISAKEMKLRVFDYIEGFYNRERLHSANGNMSPLNFEKKYEEKLSTILT